MTAPRPVTMADLTPGVKVRHITWGDTGTIRVLGGTTVFRRDEHLGDCEVSPEGPVFPSDLEILGSPA